MKKLFDSGYILILVAAFGFSIKSIMVKLAFSHGVDAMTLLIMRIFISLPFFIVTLIVIEGKNVLRVTRAEIMLFALMGIMALGGAMLLSLYSLERISASVATILIFTYPAMTVLMLRIFFKERLGMGKLLSTALTFLGLLMVVRIGGVNHTDIKVAGFLLALGAGFFAAIHSVLTQKALGEISPIRVITFSIFFLALFLGVFFGRRVYPSDPRIWGFACVLGIVSGFLGFAAMTYGMKKLGAYRAVMLGSVSPGLTALWAAMFLGEKLSAMQITGMGLILLGVISIKLRNPLKILSERGYYFSKKAGQRPGQ